MTSGERGLSERLMVKGEQKIDLLSDMRSSLNNHREHW